jgi:hypothetical protein
MSTVINMEVWLMNLSNRLHIKRYVIKSPNKFSFTIMTLRTCHIRYTVHIKRYEIRYKKAGEVRGNEAGLGDTLHRINLINCTWLQKRPNLLCLHIFVWLKLPKITKAKPCKLMFAQRQVHPTCIGVLCLGPFLVVGTMEVE